MKRGGGTQVRREVDFRRIAAGLASPGMDTRSWLERGTVATVGGADGGPDFADEDAVVIDAHGVDVDVVIGVDEHPVTCRWGISFGDLCFIPPIRPGYQVLVAMPGGDLGNVPEIVRIVSGAYEEVPLDPGDRKPLFRNDRVLIHAKNVPLDLRTAGGARLLLNQDGTIQVGDGATEAMVLGTTYRDAEAAMNSADDPAGLGNLAQAASAACVGPLAALKPFFQGMVLALATFEGKSSGFLSDKAKVK